MSRFAMWNAKGATSLSCDCCGLREHGPVGADHPVETLLAEGWWAESAADSDHHLCGDCFQAQPLAVERFVQSRDFHWWVDPTGPALRAVA